MGPHGWGQDRPLTELLYDEGYRFDFFQAVRLLEVIHPDRTPVGEGSVPLVEVIRFQSGVGIDFPASDIHEVLPGGGADDPDRMVIRFMGLAGALGPMPMPYTELLLSRIWRKDTALRDFLDIFNHRLVSLMYRVRKIYRIGFDPVAPHRSRFARYLYALMGLGTSGLADRMAVADRALLYYTGMIAQQPRSMRALEQILGDYFGVPVSGEMLTGRWYPLDDDQWTRIGETGENRTLGESATLGTRVWDQEAGFIIHLGPLPLDRFLEFLPVGPAFAPLHQLTRFFVGEELEFDIRPHLTAGTDARLGLGERPGPRLGWSAWLRGDQPPSDYGPVRLRPRLLMSWVMGNG